MVTQASQAINDIQNLRGMDEFKELAKKLLRLAHNRHTLSAARIRLPNYLFAIAPGSGTTTHLHQLARLLESLELMRFEGERKCFEWIIDRKAFDSDGAFDHLLAYIKAMAGFRSAFYGIVGLDIDDWCDHPNDAKLDRLLDFCEDMQDQILFVYIVDLHDEEKLTAISTRLSCAAPLELIRFPLPSQENLTLSLIDFINDRGFTLDDDAVQYLQSLMPKIIDVEQFDGYQTLDNLSDEIIYRFCSSREQEKPLLSKNDLLFIEQPGGYLDRFKSADQHGRRRRIGFDSRRNL